MLGFMKSGGFCSCFAHYMIGLLKDHGLRKDCRSCYIQSQDRETVVLCSPTRSGLFMCRTSETISPQDRWPSLYATNHTGSWLAIELLYSSSLLYLLYFILLYFFCFIVFCFILFYFILFFTLFLFYISYIKFN